MVAPVTMGAAIFADLLSSDILEIMLLFRWFQRDIAQQNFVAIGYRVLVERGVSQSSSRANSDYGLMKYLYVMPRSVVDILWVLNTCEVTGSK